MLIQRARFITKRSHSILARRRFRPRLEYLESRDCPSGLAPIGVNDSFSILAENDITGNVLTNDSDPEYDPLTASLKTIAANGNAVVQLNGDITYTPNNGFLGSDSFTYEVSDGTSFVETTVNVQVDLTADPVSGITGTEGSSLTNEVVATFEVTDSNLTAGDFSAVIDWGDGSATSSGTIVKTGGTSYEVQGTHTYADDGNFNIEVAIDDNAGNNVKVVSAATISNQAPNLTLSGNSTVDELSTYTLNLSSSDPGDDTISEWSINWGDGNPAEIVTGNPSAWTHVYNVPGAYSINATATDEDGVHNAANYQSVTVNNVKPTITMFFTIVSEKWVDVSGTVTDGQPGNLTVTITGVISKTVQTDSNGDYGVLVEASGLGNFTATVTDLGDLTSDPVTKTLTSNAPVITQFVATQQSGNFWTFSGQITDEDPENLVIQFGNMTSLVGKTATVNADGTFSVTIELAEGETGTATAQVTDWWGLESNIAQEVVDNT